MDAFVPSWELVGRLGDDEVVVVDVRSAEELRSLPMQIPGAIRMSFEDIQASPRTLPDDELIVLCDGGDGILARRASRVLRMAGRRALVLKGGLPAWLHAGFPTERITLGPTAARAASRSGSAQVPAALHGHG